VSKFAYDPKTTRNVAYTPRMIRRKRKKSDYQKFLKTVAPDLMISDKVLKRNYPGFDKQK
jgi:hypothetical protein